ncbi:nitrite/sulfite reductase [Sinisalibacter aestuarii]|uniref:Sulfite reductase n=1 Tax=Sinisalibacter aestuarii TaxID=2949426 RepID=A0ABQ5LX23_9RHOB|nr:nitrite/sulfite reductase [Sinisalibacter aestuarii]GKY89469.1 sulfite reductase [Sinisalibacter aestuarii]
MLDDAAYLSRRAEEFRAQVARRLDGSLTEEEFRPLRLMNGLYLQLHAYMLRVALPYGTLTPARLRALADIAERWDKGYGHFTTRQNIQFNWPRLIDVPDMLDRLAEVGLHAIQTSGNTIRNVTADPFAGAGAGEVADPRPVAELIRLWSTDHPEFQFLPRKFKIAVTGNAEDRAITAANDLGIRITERDGRRGYTVLAGGGLGRTPVVGQVLADFLPEADLLPYLEAVLGAYNLAGRRDNKYKARIKITLAEQGVEAFRAEVERRFAALRPAFRGADRAVLAELRVRFASPALRNAPTDSYDAARKADPVFRAWADTNLRAHRAPGHSIAIISLKPVGGVPGDATSAQMRAVANLAERYGYGDIRAGLDQNLILPHVHLSDLPALHAGLRAAGLATANAGLVTDIVSCPGMDYCSLATARAIPVAQEIARALDGIAREAGALSIRISGCINACGHHHLGDIGILGLEKGGVESYQVTLGGRPGTDMAIGTRAGPGFAADEIVPAIARLAGAYLALRRDPGEAFSATIARTGPAPFIDALYQETAHAL